MALNENNWREAIAHRLRERNKNESSQFSNIIMCIEKLRIENLELKILIREGNGSTNDGNSMANAKVQELEKKVLGQQEELTDLHKRKGENSQLIINQNLKIGELTRALSENEKLVKEQEKIIKKLTQDLTELNASYNTLKDESISAILRANSAEEQLRKVQEENSKLVEQFLMYKAKDAEKLNAENDRLRLVKRKQMENELQNAISEISGPSAAEFELDYFGEGMPSGIQFKFDAHEGEVNAVRWSPIERIIATGGTDRKVKLWDVGKGCYECRGTLVGSNQGVNSVEFDASGALIVAASNDMASRVWSVADHRLRHTLTGHSAKVMAAKFLGSSLLVTGSHDRTLKIWDLKNRSCTETKFAGSSCNDLVTTDSLGSTIISGHFDKKIRFWDARTDSSSNDILLQGRITSLDLSKDGKMLLCCVRDDAINLLDLRQNRIIRTFSNDNYKVGCDFSRVAFNPNSSKVAAGSADGTVFIWNVDGRLETSLKDLSSSNHGLFFRSAGNSAAVTAVSWHPFNSILASVDKSKKCTVWAST